MEHMLVILSIIIVFLSLGSIYQVVGSYIYKRKYKPFGNLIKIQNHNMHIFGTGKGENTIVLVAGSATPSPYVDFQPLWSRLNKDNRVVVVERFGYGFSDVSNTERTLDNTVNEMKEALEKNREKFPYTIVGHSYGGQIAIRFAQMYPEQVKAIVMLDAPVPAAYSGWEPNNTMQIKVMGFIRNTGILRLIVCSKYGVRKLRLLQNEYKHIPKEFWPIDKMMLVSKIPNSDIIKEIKLLKYNNKRILENNMPFSKSTLFISTPFLYKTLTKAKDGQAEYMKNCKYSKLLELNGGHYIHQYYPDEICQEIKDLII